MLFFLLINVKMPTFFWHFKIYEQEKFHLSRVEHEISFIISGPEFRHRQEPMPTTMPM